MRVLFLNQYFPPDPAPTGALLGELAERLAARGDLVDFVGARQDYRAGQGKGGRMRRELLALGRMLVDALRRPRADVVISASSPPCLGFVAALVAWRHRARHVHWVMDLYPEIAVALGEVRPGAVVSVMEWLMRWGYRRAAAVVTLDEDMRARFAGFGVKSTVLRPWVLRPVAERLGAAPAPIRTGETGAAWTWIYSGNLGRAHEWQTLLEAQAIVERSDPEMRLLFQGGGPSWAAAQARARELGLQRCDWQPFVAEGDLAPSLLRCQVCVATQRPETQGLLWPSKLGLLLSLPRSILFVGPPEGAIASLLRPRTGTGIFAPGQAGEVAAWLLARRQQGEAGDLPKAIDAAAHREESLGQWTDLLGKLLKD